MARLVAATLLLSALLAGCSTAGTTPSSAGTTTPTTSAVSSPGTGSSSQLCSGVSSLRDSVTALKNVQITSDGLPALQQAVQKVQTDAQAVIDAGKSAYGTQTARLQTDVTALRAAVDAAKAAPSVVTLTAVRTAVGTLADDVSSIAGTLGSGC